LTGALLCLAAFWAAGAAAAHYQILYGRHGWSAPEIAFLLNFLLLGLLCAGLLTVALAALFGDRLAEGFARLQNPPPEGLWLVPASAAIFVGALVVGARYLLLRDAAITDDENVYAFMARLWAHGHLYAPSPPMPIRAFFDNQFIVNDGRWYGIYAPGHPFALSLGERLGATRWITTIEATLTVPLAWALARRAYGLRASFLTLALLTLSPFFLLLSATMLAHVTAALALTAFTYAAVRIRESPAATIWWLAAGIALGGLGLTRPLTAMAYAVPWLVLFGYLAARERRCRRGVLVFAGCVIAAVVVFAGYNGALTGNPLRTGYHVFAAANNFTFTVGSLTDVPAPLAMLHELYYALARINFWLLGWPVSLLLIPFFKRTALGWALAAGAAAPVVAYAVARVPSINVVGPVHYGELVVPLLVLSASGLEQLVARTGRATAPLARRAVLYAPVALSTVAVLFFWPVYAPTLRLMADIARAPYDLVEEMQLDNAIVFVQSLPAQEVVPGAWVYRHRNNSPDLSDRVLFVNDRGPDNAKLLAYLPGRAAYRRAMDRGRLVLLPIEEGGPVRGSIER
jgi:hypothetical protein